MAYSVAAKGLPSERHLKLDTTERKAFVETYLALRMDNEVSDNNESLVLASLMRPTQDGIIKDDDRALDPSLAAMISKVLSK